MENVMELSIYLAQLIGPVLALTGLVVLFQPLRVKALAREVIQGEAVIFLAGLITLIGGLALVLSHNVWVWDWRVVITLLGWLAVVGGIGRVAFARQIKDLGAAMADHRLGLAIPGGLMVLIGIMLSWIGYQAAW